MKMLEATHAIKLSVALNLVTPLLLRSGLTGDFTDSTIERVPKLNDNEPDKLLINGYVWASLIRRALARLKDGEALAARIGKYQDEGGVSPLWCEATTTLLHTTDVTPGIRISRKWGATEGGALFSDELAMAGLPLTLDLTFFCTSKDKETPETVKPCLLQALSVINAGIENIGGGWGYGYGRLSVTAANMATLDLTTPEGRAQLWGNVTPEAWTPVQPATPVITKGWTVINVQAKVADGQLLAVKTGVMPMEELPVGKLPDTFVFRRNRLVDGVSKQEPVIPGKAIRLALLSVPLERKWRSRGSGVCESTTHGKQRLEKDRCQCLRCRWFGSTDAAGVIAVTDALVDNAKPKVVINRVQLCEHSMQNMNLFAGEYLTAVEFRFKVIIDDSRAVDASALVGEVTDLLTEMKGENAPPGWYRLGGTATCTGQVQVVTITQEGANP
jgi:hypothetical protein